MEKENIELYHLTKINQKKVESELIEIKSLFGLTRITLFGLTRITSEEQGLDPDVGTLYLKCSVTVMCIYLCF